MVRGNEVFGKPHPLIKDERGATKPPSLTTKEAKMNFGVLSRTSYHLIVICPVILHLLILHFLINVAGFIVLEETLAYVAV